MLKIILTVLVFFTAGFGEEFKGVKYKKSFSMKHYGSVTGGGIYGDSYLMYDENGVVCGAFIKAKVSLFKHYYEIAKIQFKGVVDPSSFEDTSLGVDFFVFGNHVYFNGSSIAGKTGVSTPTVDESSITATTQTQKNQKIKAAKIKLAKDKIDSLSDGVLGINVNLTNEDLDITMAKELHRTLFIGPFPVYIKMGVGGKAGFDINIGLTGITSVIGKVTPYTSLGAYASAGLGFGFDVFGIINVEYSAGVKGEMDLVTESLTSDITGELELVTSGDYVTSIKGTLHEQILNTLGGPSGRLKRYVSYYGPSKKKISDYIKGDENFLSLLKGWDQRYYDSTITSWHSSSTTKVLLDKSEDAFEIPLITPNAHIVFYDDYNCSGNEVGVFDSAYKSDVDCSKSLICESQKARSVLITQDTLPDTVIKVYSAEDADVSSHPYTVITVGSLGVDSNVCVPDFEHQTNDYELSKNISVEFHNIKHKTVSKVYTATGEGSATSKEVIVYRTIPLNGTVQHIKVYK